MNKAETEPYTPRRVHDAIDSRQRRRGVGFGDNDERSGWIVVVERVVVGTWSFVETVLGVPFVFFQSRNGTFLIDSRQNSEHCHLSAGQFAMVHGPDRVVDMEVVRLFVVC
eukprot:scaffold362_cov176-Amphora_coffeaeformis.AAC.43